MNPRKHRALSRAAVFAAVLLVLSGVVYARYSIEGKYSAAVTITAGTVSPFTITGETEDTPAWVLGEDENGTPTLTLTCTLTGSGSACLSVLALCQAEPTDWTVTLSVDGSTSTYTGRAAISPGSTLYESFGAGWIYRFYDEEDTQLTLSPGESGTKVTVTVSGCKEEALLELMVTQAAENG
ncbi:MAG: hypothetical protein LIO42_01785 [Oscillospiraceae bacterium]|nr:hypothetical protein [Oscillospiraceae bacterium]